MKKIKLYDFYLNVLFIMVVALPFIEVMGSITGYKFIIIYYFPTIMIGTIIYIVICIHLLRIKEYELNKRNNKFCALLMPLSVINLYMNIWKSVDIMVTGMCLICVIFTVVILLKKLKDSELKILSIIISGIMLLPFGLIAFIFLVLDSIVESTIVNTVVSPNGKYWAEVIESSQGVLGGETIVQICSQKDTVNLVELHMKI